MAAGLAPSHKPRKKRSGLGLSSAFDQNGQPAFPLASLLWPARSALDSPWLLLVTVLVFAGLFRWALGLWPYSGFQSPPMHGDFEAQRHWMELTTNLPVSHWYFHDLQWWGLDYPPLTAYHSWLLGKIGSLFHAEWFALYLSHGLDDSNLKIFMRGTVLASEYLIYVPAVYFCVRNMAPLTEVGQWDKLVALTAILLQPGVLLIDHGHFQYNTVMLGFFVATLANMFEGQRLISCVNFVHALAFKQMALFWAPAVAAYLAGTCFFPRLDIAALSQIAVVTAATFAALVAPFVLGILYDIYRGIPLDVDVVTPPLFNLIPLSLPEGSWYRLLLLQLTQMIHRVFPFSRGLFEDKVANFWCALHSSGIHKLSRYDSGLLSKAALGLTLVSILPPCFMLFINPRRETLLYGMAATAWGFFMCSYQVHEKNVLLPLMPMTLLLAAKDGLKPAIRSWVGFANIVGCWTMYPLLKRDGLSIPYAVLTLLWWWLLALPPFSFSTSKQGDAGQGRVFVTALQLVFYAVMIAWHIVEAFVEPPNGKPDLWVVINVCIGAAAFGICYLWCLLRMAEVSQLLYYQKQSSMVKKRQ